MTKNTDKIYFLENVNHFFIFVESRHLFKNWLLKTIKTSSHRVILELKYNANHKIIGIDPVA